MAENVNVSAGGAVATAPGSAGLQTQVPGQSSTVSGLADASGGIAPGNLVETDIDEQLFRFQSEDTALMSLMLKAKKVKVASPEVEHYMIDEQRATLTVQTSVSSGSGNSFILPLESNDQQIPRDYHTLLVCGVSGYEADGSTATPGKDLMLFVTGRDTATGNPVCRAVNGPKSSANAQCSTPAIPAGTKIKLLGNALYETQKEVDPDLIIPQPSIVYLQKRGMNQIVSDYFEAQKKHLHFTQAMIAEQAILNFKRAGNRTLWAGQKGKLTVNVPKLGQQYVYFTEGIRWQFKRELQHTGKWTIEKLIALAKLFFTGEDVPKTALLLAGKNLLEEIQCIDFSKHPEIQIISKQNPIGWSVTSIHTVFGDIDIKREPTLDTLGWSNSGALIGEDRLVHYSYSSQHEFSDRVEGEEATRKGMVVWDALCLKGSCHIWIDGEGDAANSGATTYSIWESEESPEAADVTNGTVYYFTVDCVLNETQTAQNGTMWKATVDGGTLKWTEFTGTVEAGE